MQQEQPLSPSELIELAELLASQTRTDEGEPLPLEDAITLAENSTSFTLNVSPRSYIELCQLILAIKEHGALVPAAYIPMAVSEALAVMSNNGIIVVRRSQYRAYRLLATTFGTCCIFLLFMLLFRG